MGVYASTVTEVSIFELRRSRAASFERFCVRLRRI